MCSGDTDDIIFAFIWSDVCVHMMNVSPIVTVLVWYIVQQQCLMHYCRVKRRWKLI